MKRWYCSGFKDEANPCNFDLPLSFCEKELDLPVVKELITNLKTKQQYKMKSKAGKEFQAHLTLTPNAEKENKLTIGLAFSQERFNCPKCHKETVGIYKPFAKCTQEECGFILWRKVANAELADNDLITLLNGRKTRLIANMKSQKGNTFSAYLTLNKSTFQVQFELHQKKPSAPKR